jgi:hypothetical protein
MLAGALHCIGFPIKAPFIFIFFFLRKKKILWIRKEGKKSFKTFKKECLDRIIVV